MVAVILVSWDIRKSKTGTNQNLYHVQLTGLQQNWDKRNTRDRESEDPGNQFKTILLAFYQLSVLITALNYQIGRDFPNGIPAKLTTDSSPINLLLMGVARVRLRQMANSSGRLHKVVCVKWRQTYSMPTRSKSSAEE